MTERTFNEMMRPCVVFLSYFTFLYMDVGEDNFSLSIEGRSY